MEKIGKNVMNMKAEIAKPQINIESQIGSNSVDVNDKVDKSRDLKLENPTREKIKNIEAPVMVSVRASTLDEVGKELLTDEIPNLKMPILMFRFCLLF